jgi:O-methyltransferase
MRDQIKRLVPRAVRDILRGRRSFEARLLSLEEGRQNRRYIAMFDLADYLVGAQVAGDYCEFGVYRGDTFSYAYRLMAGLFPEMRFIAADSFQGLPRPEGLDALNGYTGNFHEREFYCSEADFLTKLRQHRIDLARVRTIKGWFHETLSEGKASGYEIHKIAAAWIDCDLYESTVPVLDFLLPRLSVGSVLVFDDWRCFRNLPELGEQRACREWLARNPQLSLNELFSFGFHGLAMTVGAC